MYIYMYTHNYNVLFLSLSCELRDTRSTRGAMPRGRGEKALFVEEGS